jgi:hypothetical protein
MNYNTRPRILRNRLLLALSLALTAAIGCGDDDAQPEQKPHPTPQKHPDAGSDAGSDAGDVDQEMGGDVHGSGSGGRTAGTTANSDGGVSSGSGGRGGENPGSLAVPEPAIPEGVCARGGLCETLQLAGGNKADLLFVIDNSNGMASKQVALRAQFPTLIAALVSGDSDGDGKADVAPATDLHLAVVSSDMGALGIDGVDGCSGFGDDGIFQHTPSPDLDCEASYPSFLSFSADKDDAKQSAKDLACIASLGTGGCGFEQPLEAALKALWPTIDPMANGGMNRITFLGDSNGQGILGHGDTENLGFLRNDPETGLSVIAVVVVTDEDDGSSSNTRHLTPSQFLDPMDPLSKVSFDLRNMVAPDELYKLERYTNGLRALRPNNENLVVFGAIAGVPPDLVDADKIAQAETSDEAREAFYDDVMNDARMQETVDPATSGANARLLPSCVIESGKAFPPRRIVQVARGYGKNGFIQSVCQDNLEPAVHVLAKHIGSRLGSGCVGERQTANADGQAACNVVWELPKAENAPDGVPVSCKDLDFATASGTSDVNGGALCKIDQAALQDGKPTSDGWFVEGANETCPATGQHVAFSKKAQPPAGVRVFIDCD